MRVSLVRYTQAGHSILKQNNFYHLCESKGGYKVRFIKNGATQEYSEKELNIKYSDLDIFFEYVVSDGLCALESNEFYWEILLELLNSLPNDVITHLSKDILKNLSQIAIQLLPKNILSKVILSTPLRELYSLLGDDVPKTLSSLFLDSIEKFKLFDNKSESFCGFNKRKPLSASKGKDTQVLQSFFQESTKRNGFVEIRPGGLKYKFLDYEVSPIRATRALLESGLSGRSSGTGGLDIVCLNLITGLPVLIEYKSRSDHSLFYALIQLLTYASELSTENQFERLKNCYGLECEEKKLELVIIFDEDKKKEEELESLLDQCREFMAIGKIRKYIQSLIFIKNSTSGKEKISLKLIEHIS